MIASNYSVKLVERSFSVRVKYLIDSCFEMMLMNYWQNFSLVHQSGVLDRSNFEMLVI